MSDSGIRRAPPVMTVVAWLLAGVAGALTFWLVQVLAGEGTIPQFMGEQIAATAGYPSMLGPAIGWAVHLGVSLTYAGLFLLVAGLFVAMGWLARVVGALAVALILGWMTTLIAPPAISVTISVLAGQGWPAELLPLNLEAGLPLWNHLLFFGTCWCVQLSAAPVYDRLMARLRPASHGPVVERSQPARADQRP